MAAEDACHPAGLPQRLGQNADSDQTDQPEPEVYGIPSREGWPSETDYGDQVTEYDDGPPGRGHGGEGYGYGSPAAFGPGGGSEPTSKPEHKPGS